MNETDQGAEDEEDHEDTTEVSFTRDVTVADRRHGDQCEVDALPVGETVNILEVVERVARVLHLHQQPRARASCGHINDGANAVRESETKWEGRKWEGKGKGPGGILLQILRGDN